jgi:hypothetical protein
MVHVSKCIDLATESPSPKDKESDSDKDEKHVIAASQPRHYSTLDRQL